MHFINHIIRAVIYCFLSSIIILNDGYSQQQYENRETDVNKKKQGFAGKLENIYSSFSNYFIGFFEYRNFTYFRDDSSDDRINRAEGVIKLEYEKYIENPGKILVSPKLVFDNDNYSSI